VNNLLLSVKRGVRFISVIRLLVLILIFYTLSQAQDDMSKLLLEHADNLDFMGGESDILELNGNVHFTQEDIDLKSEKAIWYRKSGLVRFIGSVNAVDEGRTIDAREVTYYSRDKRVIAEGDVRIEDSAEDIILICGKADYFRRTKRFYAYEKPLLILNPYDDSSRVEIKSKRLEYFAADSSGSAYDSVVITRQNLVATGGEADFQRNPEEVILYQNPVVIQEDNRLTGDTISIFSKNRDIERLITRGDASALYTFQPDTTQEEYTTAELTGKELEVFFENDRVHKAVMRDNAISFYIPASTDTITKGTNRASGDSITLYFDEGAIKRVYISGGAEGEYIEPKTSADSTVFDTTVYSGSVIDYDFSKSSISLFNGSSLHYQDMTLHSGIINYDLNERILSASGIENDTTGELSQLPVLLQGTEELDGVRMAYNLNTDKGQVTQAKTVYEEAYYSSKSIRQVSEDAMFVSQGNYTSCDLEEGTHYHFHSDKMKLIGKDKVVAKPVLLYIGEIPVMAIPYYVFPIRKGRHSGFLTFEIGNFERGERFIRNVGYYWAASDYWDLESSLDFYENDKILINNRIRYRLLYKLNGDVGVIFERRTRWSDFKRNINTRWQLNLSHNQTISPSVALRANGRFVSDKNFIEDNIYDPVERLNRTVRSTGSLTKSWKSSSLVISAEQNWNLDTDERRDLLPSFRFSRSSLPIFPDPAKSEEKKRFKPWEERELPKQRFYHNIYFNFSTAGQNLNQRIRRPDSTYYWKKFQTLNSTASLSLNQDVFTILTVTPRTDVYHTVYHVDWNREVGNLGLETSRLFTRETYSLGVSAKSSLYGTIYPNIFGITGLRHVLTPSVGYTFTPEIDKNDEYRDYTGVGRTSRRSKSISFSLDNFFQSKYKSGEDEKKLDLFTLNISGNYDFVPEVRKIGDPSLTIRTSALPYISLNFSSDYSFYNFDDSRRSLWNPRLRDLGITSSLKGGYRLGSDDSDDSEDDSPDRYGGRSPFGAGRPGGSTSSRIGFDYTIRHDYKMIKSETGTSKTQWINFTLNLKPTLKWDISYANRYSIEDKNIESQTLSISRDMHCWQGEFTWIPNGPIAGYYVTIYIKTLPDIKVEKSEGGVRGKYYR
jgi:lipopolysaccharide assembly outer membrane protein LptD (OstA)